MISWDYWHNTWPESTVLLSRGNSADGYPKPLTPLTQDLVLRFEDQGAYDFVHEILGVRPSREPRRPYFLALWGYVLVDADLHAALGAAMPGNSKRATLQRYMALEPDPDQADRDDWVARVRRAPARAAVVARMIREGRRAPARIAGQLEQLRAARPEKLSPARPERLPPARAEDLRTIAPGSGELTEADCLAWLRRLDELQAATWTTLMLGAGIAGTSFRLTSMLVARATDRARPGGSRRSGGDLANRLHVAVGGNESAEMAHTVRRLAQAAQRNPAVTAALAQGASPEQVKALDSAFAALFDEALDRFGFHTTPELELAQPTWRQDPAQLLVVVARESSRPAELVDATATRAAAEAELRRLASPLLRLAIGVALRASRHMMGVRENAKTPAVLLFDELRRVLEVAGPLLVARGVLAQPSDAVYLRYDELHSLLAGGVGPGITTVAERKRQLARCVEVALPDLIEARSGWVGAPSEAAIRSRGMLPPEVVSELDTVFRGVAAAPGSFTGIVRVLDEPWGDFEAGEVLVAKTVDPGWSATLSLAGAIVLDLGGPMSHGAMVARELGVPCVVGTRVTSARLSTGMKVTVDGSTGEVRAE